MRPVPYACSVKPRRRMLSPRPSKEPMMPKRLPLRPPRNTRNLMIKDLNLSELLRYVFSGTIFMAALEASRHGIDDIKTSALTVGEEGGFLLAAIVIGSLLYSAHRCV